MCLPRLQDEIDAICKQRGRGGDSTGVHDTVVNQLLSKIDGVNALNNILVIGMTNRKDMIDSALLRPGRLEVHIEIGLPDEKGRKQIFEIHLKTMRESKMLGDDVSSDWLAAETKNFSGAEIEGVVKSASSFALYESIDIKKTGAKPIDTTGKDIKVMKYHFEKSLGDVKAAFGVDEDELEMYTRGQLYNYGPVYDRIVETMGKFINQVKNSKATPLLSVLLEGPNGSGKTSIAARLAKDSGYPYVKVISPELYVGDSEVRKCAAITKIFEDAYKSPLSLIILDSIERLLEYVAVGPRFSQMVLQTLLVLVNRVPPTGGRRLLIIGTSSRYTLLDNLEITQAFNVVQPVMSLKDSDEVLSVLRCLNFQVSDSALRAAAQGCYLPMPIKSLLMVAEMSREQGNTEIGNLSSSSPAPEATWNQRFADCLVACGFDQAGSTTSASASAAAAYGSVAGKKPKSRQQYDEDED
jgi:vesicle-fusing ATPase